MVTLVAVISAALSPSPPPTLVQLTASRLIYQSYKSYLLYYVSICY
jgi:hypothetical protein